MLKELQKIQTNFASYFLPDSTGMPQRRYDLDWLRVIVFGLLILFHTGMFYVASWSWHAKSEHLSAFLENIMLIVEPWRMPVLWVIAGISIRFILAKVSLWRFISIRSLRLLLPLLFGVLVVVPPQLYVEMTINGDLNMNFWSFMAEFFNQNSTVFEKYQSGIWPHIDVNHLWFIRSLWQFSLLILCLLPLLNSTLVTNSFNRLMEKSSITTILIATLPIFIIQSFWEVSNTRYPIGFTLMLYGYLIGWHKVFWLKLSQSLKPLLLTAVFSYIILIIFYNGIWVDLIKGEKPEQPWLVYIGMFNYSLLRVIGVLTMFSIAYKFLNKKSKKLTYFNDAVYPFYILHQTLIIVIGYNLSLLKLGPVIEPVLLIVMTLVGCFVCYEIIRHTNLLRPLFGLKMNKSYSPAFKKLTSVTACLLIIPIAFEVLI